MQRHSILCRKSVDINSEWCGSTFMSCLTYDACDSAKLCATGTAVHCQDLRQLTEVDLAETICECVHALPSRFLAAGGLPQGTHKCSKVVYQVRTQNSNHSHTAAAFEEALISADRKQIWLCVAAPRWASVTCLSSDQHMISALHLLRPAPDVKKAHP